MHKLALPAKDMFVVSSPYTHQTPMRGCTVWSQAEFGQTMHKVAMFIVSSVTVWDPSWPLFGRVSKLFCKYFYCLFPLTAVFHSVSISSKPDQSLV